MDVRGQCGEDVRQYAIVRDSGSMCVGDEMMIRDAATKVLRRMHASAGDRKRRRCLVWEATATVRDECKGAESNVNGINRSFSGTGREESDECRPVVRIGVQQDDPR